MSKPKKPVPSPEELRKKLTSTQYAIAFKEATERAGSGPWLNEKRHGVFTCIACGEPLFASEAKYESGSGWPSFYQPIDGEALATKTDMKIGYPRTEVHCANCGAHMGHVFDDGPAPTGKRYCINGTVLDFEEKK